MILAVDAAADSPADPVPAAVAVPAPALAGAPAPAAAPAMPGVPAAAYVAAASAEEEKGKGLRWISEGPGQRQLPRAALGLLSSSGASDDDDDDDDAACGTCTPLDVAAQDKSVVPAKRPWGTETAPAPLLKHLAAFGAALVPLPKGHIVAGSAAVDAASPAAGGASVPYR